MDSMWSGQGMQGGILEDQWHSNDNGEASFVNYLTRNVITLSVHRDFLKVCRKSFT
jgi:hypothetical protein